MQAKLPVLAVTDPNTDIGKVIVDGDFGWWCESNHADNVRKSVEEIIVQIRDFYELNKMKQNAYRYLREYYSSSVSYETIIGLFRLK